MSDGPCQLNEMKLEYVRCADAGGHFGSEVVHFRAIGDYFSQLHDLDHARPRPCGKLAIHDD